MKTLSISIVAFIFSGMMSTVSAQTMEETQRYIQGWFDKYNSCSDSNNNIEDISISFSGSIIKYYHEEHGYDGYYREKTYTFDLKKIDEIIAYKYDISVNCAGNYECATYKRYVETAEGGDYTRTSSRTGRSLVNCSRSQEIAQKVVNAFEHLAELHGSPINQEFDLDAF